MSLTPEEITNAEFTIGLRGYDQDEVREFLLRVAAEVADSARLQAHGVDSSGDVSIDTANARAAAILERAQNEAAEIRQSATAEAEIVRSRARTVLAVAQEEALRLVAEAHVRIDRRSGGSGDHLPSNGAGGGGSTVEQLGEEISAMVKAREDVLGQLHMVLARVEDAVEAAEADPVMGRAASPASA